MRSLNANWNLNEAAAGIPRMARKHQEICSRVGSRRRDGAGAGTGTTDDWDKFRSVFDRTRQAQTHWTYTWSRE